MVDGLYVVVAFPDGMSNVCDDCFDQREDPDRFATWQDTLVEVS